MTPGEHGLALPVLCQIAGMAKLPFLSSLGNVVQRDDYVAITKYERAILEVEARRRKEEKK